MSRKDKKNARKKTGARFQQLNIFDFLAKKKAGSEKEKIMNMAAERLSRGIPFDDPSGVTCKGKYFCLAGRFRFGTHAECSEAISKLEGLVLERLTSKTDYLVVGEKLNYNWKSKYYGLKIQKALFRKLSGADIRLVKEADLDDILPKDRIGASSGQMIIEDFLYADLLT